jgi:hypothetical protein
MLIAAHGAALRFHYPRRRRGPNRWRRARSSRDGDAQRSAALIH